MESALAMPDWLIWLAAGGAGWLALVTLARSLEAVLDLDPR